MDTLIVNETQLITEIERLREQFPQTQDLYREVCALLFFRYGTTPTANKLYQLVRKGSMSAPAEALSKFWSILREKSRVQIEHPDLPDSLKTAAGELATAVWTAALEQANLNMATYRQEADLAIDEAQNSMATAISERDTAKAALEQSQKKLIELQTLLSELEQSLAAEKAINASFDKQLVQAKAENASLQERIDTARRDFGGQLEQLRLAASQAEERFQSMEKRSLLEIDRERQATVRLQKEVEASRLELTQAGKRHRNETEELHSQIGNLRQQLGALEGKLHEMTEAKKELASGVKELASREQKLAAHAAALESDLQNWKIRAERAESAIDLQRQEKVVKRTKKPAKAP